MESTFAPIGPPIDPEHMELVEVLAASMSLEFDPLLIETAIAEADPTAPWAVQVDEVLAAAGLRVRWMVAPLSDVAKLARPDLPVIGRTEAGTVWVLDGRGLGMTHGIPVADPRGPRWMGARGLASRLGIETRPWGLVEPMLPAAPLACPDGTKTPVQRLWSLMWVERSDVAVVMLYGAVAGLLSLATPLAIQMLINWLAFGALLQPIIILGAALFVALLLAAALQLLQRVGVEAIERRVFVRTVADLSTRLSRVRIDALDGLSGPELANRFFDVLTVQKAAGTLLLDGFTALLQVGVAVLLLGVYHPYLLVFDLFLLSGMLFVLVMLGRGAQETAIQESKKKYAVAAWIEEVARHPLVLRQDTSRLAETRSDDLSRSWLTKRRAHFRIFLRQYAGVQVLQVLMSTVLLVASAALVLQGELTVGQLVAAEFIVTTALLGFAKFADKLDTFYDLLAGVDKLGNLLDLPPEPPMGLGNSQLDTPLAVELNSASFEYATGGGLTPVDLVMPAGSHTVIYGAPGVGKSTLAAIVVGLRKPRSGVVRHDGADIARMRPESRYRGVMKLAPSDALGGSILDNITLGRPGVSLAMAWDALEQVGLRRRVESFEQGIQTPLDSSGGPLSDAERRTLLVARALVRPPRLLVLDGLLDGLPPTTKHRLTKLVAGPDCPWTLLVLTTESNDFDPSFRSLTLGPGGLDER
ncbi:MAG: ABC transporter ATP-binding protein [Myxococcota bacterium]